MNHGSLELENNEKENIICVDITEDESDTEVEACFRHLEKVICKETPLTPRETHMVRTLMKIPDITKIYLCLVCSTSLDDTNALEEHLRRHPRAELHRRFAYFCSPCFTGRDTPGEIVRHHIETHPEMDLLRILVKNELNQVVPPEEKLDEEEKDESEAYEEFLVPEDVLQELGLGFLLSPKGYQPKAPSLRRPKKTKPKAPKVPKVPVQYTKMIDIETFDSLENRNCLERKRRLTEQELFLKLQKLVNLGHCRTLASKVTTLKVAEDECRAVSDNNVTTMRQRNNEIKRFAFLRAQLLQCKDQFQY